MKAKKIIPENNEQLNPLPTPSDEERKDELAPWQKEIVALAEASPEHQRWNRTLS